MTPHDASRGGDAPGSVAEEAALLVDLLSQRGWGAPSRMPQSPSDANGHDDAHDDGHVDAHVEEGAPEQAHDEHPDADTSDRGSRRPSDRPDGSGGGHASRSECTCSGSTPAACRVCPVCQLIAFVQQVNPDTIDRVADFVGFAATALRDLATAQRERREGTPHEQSGNDGTDTTRPGGQ